jgi:hypothetical protein
MFGKTYTLYLIPDTSTRTLTAHGINDGNYVLRVRVESPYKPLYQVENGELIHLGHLEDYLLDQAADQGATSFKNRLSPKSSQRKTPLNSLNLNEEELTRLMAACRKPSPTKQASAPILREYTVSNCTSSMHSFYAPPPIIVPKVKPFQQYQEVKTEDDALEFSFDETFPS